MLVLAAIALALIGAWRRVRLWRQGRPEAVDVVGGLLALPRRYLVDLHHVVARDRYIANSHVATAGGFVAAALLVVLVFGLGLEARLLGWALLAATATMAAGAVFVALRRRNPPARLSRGPWMRLPASLLAFSLGFFLLTLPAAGVVSPAVGGWLVAGLLFLVVAWGLTELFVGMTWGGPMKHAFAGAAHLAFHRRPERFGGGHSTAIRPLDLTATDAPLGVGRPADFTWTQLLGFDACVQCGRCEAACPAFAAGQPLNPKKLVQDLVVGMTGGSDAGYRGSSYPGVAVGQHSGGPGKPIFDMANGGLLEPDTLWSCTTCRACVEECPMMIEHVDAIIDMRRHLTLEHGATPNKGAEVLENLASTDNPGGYTPEARMHWAADQNLPCIGERGAAEVLLWLGDGAFDLRNQRTLRALVKILRAADVDFAVLGVEERDSGDVARRLGDEATFQELARQNIATLGRYHFQRIVTCDPHSLHVLRNEYPALGGHYTVSHHTGYIQELLEAGRLRLSQSGESGVTYHDPCYLGRYNREYDAPRAVLAAIGVDVQEMQRSRFRSRCCGGGGGAPITDIPGKQRIPDMRMTDARDSGAQVVAVACPGCTTMLEGVVEPRPEVRDIAELVADCLPAVDAARTRPRREQEELLA
nr:(Fe-S)-binding protein [Natronocella acetinitrilica]